MASLVGKTGGVTGVEYKQRKLASPETGMIASGQNKVVIVVIWLFKAKVGLQHGYKTLSVIKTWLSLL